MPTPIPHTPPPIPPPAFRRLLPALLLMLTAVAALAAACAPRPPASDFTLTTFAGDHFRLSDQRGRAVVINFWYPSCPPCRDEMPALQQVWEQRQHDDNLRILGLFVPQGLDTEVEARQFVAELGLTFHFATDIRAQIAREYAVQYYPTTYFIDPSGRVHQMEISRLDADRLTAILNTIPNR